MRSHYEKSLWKITMRSHYGKSLYKSLWVIKPRDRQRAIALAAVKDKPFGWPRKARPSLTATRHDGAVELRSGRKNGSAGVKQKNGSESSFRAKILSSRYARAAINFPGTKNRNTRGFSHQTPWSCLPTWPMTAAGSRR